MRDEVSLEAGGAGGGKGHALGGASREPRGREAVARGLKAQGGGHALEVGGGGQKVTLWERIAGMELMVGEGYILNVSSYYHILRTDVGERTGS
jgi:hypothetical protein